MLLRKRVIATITGIAVAILAIGGGLAVTSIYAIKDIKNKIREEQAHIDERFAMHRYIRQEAAKINETRRRLREISSMALVEGNELKLITALETVAQESGVEQEISLETANQLEISSWEKMVPIRLRVNGSYVNFSDYLRRLDRLPYAINIYDIVVLQAAANRFDSDSVGDVRAELAAQVYWISKDGPGFLEDTEMTPETPEAVNLQ